MGSCITGLAVQATPKAGIPAGQPPTRRHCAVAVRSQPNPPERTAHLLERITTALDADLIVEIAPHAA